jgi:N-glycosylase/DNA lyase
MHCHSRPSNQQIAAMVSGELVWLELPAPETKLGVGRLKWGRAEEIGTPAYWMSQSWMWSLENPDHFRLGESLSEELLACLLGGYGIPAEVGLAAFERLRRALANDPESLCSPSYVISLLSDPLIVDSRQVRYRFARQKGNYIAGAFSVLETIDVEAPDRQLRDALTTLPGVGLKTASWIVRNWRGSDEVSILDVHILRAANMLNLFSKTWRVERNYRDMEEAYLGFSRAIGARASLLDSVMWMSMRQIQTDLINSFVAPGYERFQPSQQRIGLRAA